MARHLLGDSPLRVESFGRRYRRRGPWAVRDVFLTLSPGAVTALVGPNGAGKSTLIRACLGFERPDEGRILVAGTDPQEDRPRVLRSIGYVPQGAPLYRNLSIADHLTLAAAARPSFDRPHARRHLQAIGLSLERKVGDLSNGEQAQVALALALGTRAPLLLLDEPLASLDPLARRDFLTALLADIRERGATVLLSSHIVTDVEQACDRVIVLADGRVVLDAGVAAAREQFRTMAVKDLDGQPVVGTFSGPDGELLALVPNRSVGRPPSLEEIVLGHLAVARTRRRG